MATYTTRLALPNATARASWTVSSGHIREKRAGTGTAAATSPAFPVGAEITAIRLTVTASAANGTPDILTAQGMDINPAAETTVDVTGLEPVGGQYAITYMYQSAGMVLPDGTYYHEITFSDAFLMFTYTAEAPDPVPEEEEAPDTDLQVSGDIVLYSPWTVNFGTTYGLGQLSPSECTVTQEAGGEYSLELRQPMTPDGLWRQIVPMSIIRCPVPAEDTPFIDVTGDVVTEGVQIWRIADGGGGWYTNKNSTIRPTWRAHTNYSAGSYCRWNGYNWKAIASHTSGDTWAETSNFWSNQGTGAPRPARQLPEWTRLYVSASDSTWLWVKLITGETGYCKISEAVFIRTATAADIAELNAEERHITDQPFRITDVKIDGSSVVARGQHLSYDANYWILGDIEIKDETLADAILDVKASLIGEVVGESGREPLRIFAQNAAYRLSATYTGKSPTAAVLDPDVGLVPLSRSRLARDNWDFFLINNDAPVDRGFRLTYGVNLTGVSWSRDYSRLVTRIKPLAKDADGHDFPLPEEFVDSPILNSYPVHCYQVLRVDAQVGKQKPDGTTWTEAAVIQEMRDKAAERFTADRCDYPEVDLEIRFTLLGQTDEYAQYRGLERVSLYDTVTVDHPDIGLQTAFQVKSYEWDAIRQRFNRITLGDVFRYDTARLAGYEISDGAITLAKIDGMSLAQLQNGGTST